MPSVSAISTAKPLATLFMTLSALLVKRLHHAPPYAWLSLHAFPPLFSKERQNSTLILIFMPILV